MPRIVRTISTIVLAVSYLSVAQVTIEQLTPMCGSGSGDQTLSALSGKGKEPTRAVWTQRRHLPMVPQFSLSPVVTTDHFTFPSLHEYGSIDGDHPREYCSLYFSSLCNKAPPTT